MKAEGTLFCSGCGATPPNLTLSLRATSGGLPTGADLASTTIPGALFASGASTTFTGTFSSPATVTSGTQYALILRPVSAPAGSGYFWIRSSPSTYANGSRVLSSDSGATWTADTTRDYNFKTYVQTGYPASGNEISSTKDANPAAGITPIWSTLSWNSSTPANTSIQFQIAGSNNANGPFNFVGPDGTAGTFFTTSPVQLQQQFYNFRYLEYKAYLASTDPNVTPTLNDVTLCFNDVDCSSTSATITPTPATVCQNSTGNTAAGPGGMTSYAWGITNGTITSATDTQNITYTAGASGTVNLNLTVTAPNGCIVSNSVPVTIDAMPATPTISGDTNGTGTQDQACPEQPLTLHANGATGATSYTWYNNNVVIPGETTATLVVTAAGNISVTANNGACTTPPSATYVVQNPTPTTPFISFRGQSSTTTSLAICQGQSQIIDSDSPTGIQWWKDGSPIPGANSQSFTATAAGVYTAQLNALGCHSQFGRNVTITLNPLPATPTITPGGPTTFCQGGSVTLTSSSASGNQWFLNGNPIGGATNNTYIATANGNYTVTVTDANSCTSAASAATTVTVNPTPPTPTITPGGPTTFCQGNSVTLNSSAATGNQWYLNGNPIGGATNQNYVATASGNYTVVNTQLNCPSAPSAVTAVTVNPNPNATITTAAQECAGSTGNTASVANAGGGATYSWSITNGTITGGTGTPNITYTAGAAGTLILQVTVTTAAGCSDTKSANVTINAIPAKPTITPSGPTTFPSGGSVTLNSSSPSGNQWYLNGNPIAGATSSSYVANVAGNYTVIVSTSGCSSPASDPTAVTICPLSPIVTNANDSGAGSLRQAILDVCDGGTITFDMNQVVSPIKLTTAELVINKNLTITGPGANLLTVQRSTAGGTPQFRVFTINSGRTANISGLTISNGNLGSSDGGGILNQGTLTLSACAVSGNGVLFSGGGIANNGTMTISGCAIVGNTASSGGSGIANTGQLTVINSTLTANASDGLSNDSPGVVTLVNDTFSGNGVRGISNNSGTVNIRNTIVAKNPGGGSDVLGTFNSQGNNLIGNAPSGSGFTNGVNFDKAGTTAAPLDPLLAALANYGGATNMMALLPGSPALDAGSNSAIVNPPFSGSPFTDQRGAGFNRIVNGSADIGAFESRGFSILGSSGAPNSTPWGTAFNAPLVATVSSPFAEPIVGGQVTFTAPSAGASATFTGGVITLAATINASNQASVSATANNTVGGPYNASAGGAGFTTSATFNLTNTKRNQTITVGTHAPAAAAFNSSFTVAASASSTLPVSYSSAGSCTNVGATFTITSGTGACTVKYDQTGDGNYNSAPQLLESVNAQRADQTITFNALGNKTYGDADFNVSATASSGLTVTFTATGKCAISTNTVHLTGAGSCTITARQGGDSQYSAAADVPQLFSIARAATNTAVNSSLNPSNLNQSVTFTATVTGPAGTGTPTGTVTFKDGAATIACANAGGQTLNASGVATCQTSTLTATTHTISALYSSDTNFLTSTGNLAPNQVVINLPLVSFSAANYNVNESDGVVQVVVNRSGDTTVPFDVDYATSDSGASTNCSLLNTALASSRCDFDTVLGTLKFAANQTQATIDVPINQDGRTEGPETFTVNLSNATAGALFVNPSTATVTINDSASPLPNASDATTAFVRQQYHDFLNREPDAAGLAFWVDNIDKCKDPARLPVGQTILQCIQTQRVLTSASFFLSIEFMQSGTFVRSFYVAALDRPATNNMPAFLEWLRDTQAVQRGVIVNQGNWQATLDANRLAFMQDFVTRAEFVGLYPTTDTPTQYINKLYLHALTRTPTATELSDGLSVFGGAATASNPTARGQALLKVTQASDFSSREFTRAFVQIEYFGYLRRNPNDPPDGNFNGYNFWLNKLNQFNGDFVQAEMVRAFIESGEYRNRFAP